jgi:purine-binding chemotaxis protein CheW
MSDLIQLVVFRLDAQRYALALSSVERVVRAVEVTALPDAPAIVLGVIDVEGHFLPVLNLRRRFGLTDRAISLSDQFLITYMSGRTIVLAVDEVQQVIDCPTVAIVPTVHVVAGLEKIQGLVRFDDGLVLIHNLESALSLNEARALEEAMSEKAANAN